MAEKENQADEAKEKVDEQPKKSISKFLILGAIPVAFFAVACSPSLTTEVGSSIFIKEKMAETSPAAVALFNPATILSFCLDIVLKSFCIGLNSFLKVSSCPEIVF